MSNHNRKSNGSRNKLIAGISAVVIAALAIFLGFQFMSPTASSSNGVKSVLTTKKANTYKVSDEEKAYLKNKFDGLEATNPDTIAYVYAPGTKLDEPVVQTAGDYGIGCAARYEFSPFVCRQAAADEGGATSCV